jgi:hypothetical protein
MIRKTTLQYKYKSMISKSCNKPARNSLVSITDSIPGVETMRLRDPMLAYSIASNGESARGDSGGNELIGYSYKKSL